MRQTGQADMRVRKSLVLWAIVLLAGVLLLGRGYFAQSRIALCAGLILIVAGVLVLIMRIVGQTGPVTRQRKRRGT